MTFTVNGIISMSNNINSCDMQQHNEFSVPPFIPLTLSNFKTNCWCFGVFLIKNQNQAVIKFSFIILCSIETNDVGVNIRDILLLSSKTCGTDR